MKLRIGDVRNASLSNKIAAANILISNAVGIFLVFAGFKGISYILERGLK